MLKLKKKENRDYEVIAKLTGLLDTIESDGVVIDVNGIGYWVVASQKTLSNLPEKGEKLVLWIEQVTRQEITQLCGFLHQSDRLCFRQLLNVQGVGVRVALAILSVLTPDQLLQAIVTQDKTLLTRADGVGPKLASRIVLELKDRLSSPHLSLQGLEDTHASSAFQDALLGLINLGYGKAEGVKTLQDVLKNMPQATSSELLRTALQKLAKF